MPDPFTGFSIAGLTSVAPTVGTGYYYSGSGPFLAWDPSYSSPIPPAHSDGTLGTASTSTSCGPCPFPFPSDRLPQYGGPLTRDVDVYSEFGFSVFSTPPDFVAFFVKAQVAAEPFDPLSRKDCAGCSTPIETFSCEMGWQLLSGVGGMASASVASGSAGTPIELWMQRPTPVSYDGDPGNPDLVYLYHYTEFLSLQQFVGGEWGQAGIEDGPDADINSRIFPLWYETPPPPPDNLFMVV